MIVGRVAPCHVRNKAKVEKENVMGERGEFGTKPNKIHTTIRSISIHACYNKRLIPRKGCSLLLVIADDRPPSPDAPPEKQITGNTTAAAAAERLTTNPVIVPRTKLKLDGSNNTWLSCDKPKRNVIESPPFP